MLATKCIALKSFYSHRIDGSFYKLMTDDSKGEEKCLHGLVRRLYRGEDADMRHLKHMRMWTALKLELYIKTSMLNDWDTHRCLTACHFLH